MPLPLSARLYIKAEEIPLGARIVAAADVYNALTTDRPYRPAFSQQEALRMLHEMRGIQLDAHIVDALFRTLEDVGVQPSHTPAAAGVH